MTGRIYGFVVPFLVATTCASAAPAQSPEPGDFVLFAHRSIRARGLAVQSGDVGAETSIVSTKPLRAPDSRIVADSVDLHPGSTCDELLANDGRTAPGCGPARPVSLPIIPDLAAACGMTSPLPTQCTGPGIAVGHGQLVVKDPGTYGAVDVAGGGRGPGTLTLTAGVYTFCRLTLHRNARLLARGQVTIRVVGPIELDNGSRVGPETFAVSACQVRMLTNGPRVRVARKASVEGIVCAPDAKLEITAGAHLRGTFFADAVEADRATLVHGCGDPTPSTSTSTSPPSTSPSTSTTSTSSTTSTTEHSLPNQCCLPGSAGGAFVCTFLSSFACAAEGGVDAGPGVCTPDPCGVVSTSTPTSSTTSTTRLPSAFDFTSTGGNGICGSTFRDLAGTVPLKRLLCGNLSIGGGFSQLPDNVTPSGSTNRFALSCNGAACTVGPTPAPATASYDCTDTACLFGTPLPIANAGISVCVTNTFAQPVSGTLDTATGEATLNLQLSSRTTLTGFAPQPCPVCAVAVGGAPCVGSPSAPCTGVCDGSPNQGATCTTTNPKGLTNQCPSPAVVTGTQRCYRGANNNNVCTSNSQCAGTQCAAFVGDIPISLDPLTTGTTSLTGAGGLFCPGQSAPQLLGAFKSDICQTGANSGKPCTAATAPADCGIGVFCRPGTANNYCSEGTNRGLGCASNTDCGTGGVCARAGTLAQLCQLRGMPAGPLTICTPKPIRLVSAFCIPLTASGIVNSNANLPAPGATALVGTIHLLP